MHRYSINPDSDIPIYRQLVDQINAEIRSGVLPTGTQLPTVREMAEQMHLSCGTVKRVYDRLQEMGDIEMTRRRGTFVKYVREDRDSRKVMAMTAIDRMIRSLTDLNFSPAEIQIFLNLKMREWGLKWSGVRIAMITDCLELAPSLERQLSGIGNVRVSVCQLRQLREYPYSVDEQSDVILASARDGQRLQSILPDSAKLIKVAFALQSGSAYALAMQSGGTLGTVCTGTEFADLVAGQLPEEVRRRMRVLRADNAAAREAFFDGLDAVIVAPDWDSYCDAELCHRLDVYRSGGRLTLFDYRIDEGSMIYLEERINRIRDERQLQPGALRF